MRSNRSMPETEVIPVLAYPDVRRAVDWLCTAFGFRERLRIGGHRAQLLVGDGAVAVRSGENGPCEVMVRVEDVRGHRERAAAAGALILNEPADHPYGERQYTAEDIGGHRWTFSESVADVDPAEWGGVLVES